jgi:hypothetical protein
MNSSIFLLKKLFAAAILALGLLGLCSCQKKNKPSFIIIAVDRLSFNAFSCSDEKNTVQSGLAALCQESIRYSNAYTTSTQSAAAMGSLLSGSYPFNHSLHRSFDRINPDYPLVPEFFKKAGYRTAFWSGGPSILKKTGLARGFDVFDDSSFLTTGTFATPLPEQMKALKAWNDESDEPYLALIYNAELESFSENGSSTQIESFDEKLGQVIQKLKSEDMWEKNYVIVTGLQGRSEYNRADENAFTNLHTENINVAFFIKPPRQKGDEGTNLKIDTPSSVADFGYSLIKMADPEYSISPGKNFPVWDYSALWGKNELGGINTGANRKIVVESADTWSQNLSLKFASIAGHYIFIEGGQNKLFNRLNDGLETIDIARSSPDLANECFNDLSELHKKTGSEIWNGPSTEERQLAEINRRYWESPEQRQMLFEYEKKRLAKEKRPHPLSTLLIYFQNVKKEKDTAYDDARRASYNLALENSWGLWNWNRTWSQPGVTTENQ